MGRIGERSRAMIRPHVPAAESSQCSRLLGWFWLHCDLQQKWKMPAKKTPPFMSKHSKEEPEMYISNFLWRPFFPFPFGLFVFWWLSYPTYHRPPPQSNSKIFLQFFSYCLYNLHHWEIDLFRSNVLNCHLGWNRFLPSSGIMENSRQLVTTLYIINIFAGCTARGLAAPQALGKLVSGTNTRICVSLVTMAPKNLHLEPVPCVMLRSTGKQSCT